MDRADVNAVLCYLAVDPQVSPSTQTQPLDAFLVLSRQLLESDCDLDGLVRTRMRGRLPLELTTQQGGMLLARLDGTQVLVGGLLDGSGLSLQPAASAKRLEALRLRIKDRDFQRRELSVHEGKGGRDRLTSLPQSLLPALQEQRIRFRHLHGET